ncbi:uncharacterized protein LOC131937133 isoform X2 [Physella acuta]|nr:uncharacterized protein LOC131937133 isoform X2 [Physella acuta]
MDETSDETLTKEFESRDDLSSDDEEPKLRSREMTSDLDPSRVNSLPSRKGFIASSDTNPMMDGDRLKEEFKDAQLKQAARDLSSPLDSPLATLVYEERPPDYDSLRDNTEVKQLVPARRSIAKPPISFSRSSSSSSESDDDISPVDQLSLLRTIESLKQEQERMRQLQEDHDKHLKELLEREPCVHKRLESIRNSNRLRKPSHGYANASNSPLAQAVFTEEHIYVQLEQLYANFHRLHFPTKTIQSVLGHAKKDGGYYDAIALSEISSLKETNIKLRKKISELEEQLSAKPTRPHFGQTPPPFGMIPPPFGMTSPPFGMTSPPFGMTPPLPCSQMKSAKSEGRLDKVGLTPEPENRSKFVAGRPTSPLPLPIVPQEIRPVEITFRWTITDYSKKLRDEQIRGLKESSSPFYLSHCGYRAQMEAYLNGNGTATNRCMSVFLRILKGDFDRHLKWPVNLQFVVILVNQSGNHSDSLKAGGNQFQYTKPCGVADAESDCWGLIEFVSHDMIRQRQYIRDDRIILKCRVMFLP